MAEKEEDEEMGKIEITLPEDLLSLLEENEENLDRYIESLIRNDYESEGPSDVDSQENELVESAMEKEVERQEKIKEAMLEFMKKYRKDEWIQYMQESRGEEAIGEEAKRIVEKNPEDWSEFISDYTD